MKTLAAFCFLTMLCFFGVNAQLPGNHLQIVPIAPTAVTVCGPEEVFGVTMTNVSGSIIDSLTFNPLMPLGMAFVGIQSPAWSLANGLPSNAPTLRHNAALAPGNSTTLSYIARATCVLSASITDSSGIDTLLNGNRADYLQAGQLYFGYPFVQQTYNVVTPRLNIALLTPSTQTSQIGNTVIHRLRVTNTGLGAVDSMQLNIALEGELDWISAIDNNASLTFTVGVQSGNRVLFCRDNNGFQPNESVEFDLAFNVARCSPANNTSYAVQWGCGGDICNLGASNSLTSSNVSVPMQNANVVLAKAEVLDQGNYCTTDSLATARLWFTNNGIGAAHNINMDLGSSFYLGEPVSVTMAQGLVPPQLITGPLVGNIWNNGPVMRYFVLHIDSLNTDLDGPGGLSSLNGDSLYDDLSPGDTFHLDFTFDLRFGPGCMHFANLCNFSSYESYLAYSIRFENACGQSSGTGNIGNGVPFISGFNGNQAQGPTDLVPGDTAKVRFTHRRQDQFNFAWSSLWNCPMDSFIASFTLPSGLELAGDTAWFGYTADMNLAIPKPVTRIGNQIFVPGVHYVANAPVSTHFFLPIVATCPLPGQRNLQIDWEVNYICDTTCNCPLKLACGAVDIVVHCPGSSCSGLVNHGMWMRRNSFGWTDYTRSTYANANTPGVELDRVYPCDSILFTAVAIVGGGLTYTSGGLRLTYPVQFNDPLITFLSGRLLVNGLPCGGTVTANSANLVASGINPTIYTWEIPLPSTCIQGLQSGDSVAFEGHFKVGDLNILNLPIDHQIDQFRAKMYVIDGVGDTLGCDDWGARLFTLTPRTYASPWDLSTAANCQGGEVRIYNQFWNGLHYQGLPDFPLLANGLEIRPDIQIGDTIRAFIPNTFEVVQNSMTLYTGIYIPVGTVQTPLSTTMVPGTAVDEWRFVHPGWNTQGGGYTHFPFHPAVQYFSFKIRPKSCDALQGSNDSIVFIQKWTRNAFSNDLYCRIDETNVTKTRLQYYEPYLTIDPGNAIQDGYQRTTSWEVTVCNFPPPGTTAGQADSVWLAVNSGSPDLHVTEVFDYAHNVALALDSISPSQYWVRYPHPISVGGCASLRVTAEYTHCQFNDLDTIAVSAGPICGPMPSHPDSAACTIHTELIIRYKNADLQMFVTHGQAMPFDFCDEFSMELLLKSAGLGSMYAVAADVTLPPGLDFVPGSFEHAYPSTGPFQPLAPPTLQFGNHHWDISGLLFSFMGQDTGFTGIIDTFHNQIKLRFRVRPNCDFAPGSQVAISAEGETNCQSTIHLAPYLTPGLVPTGFPVPGTFDVEVTTPGLTCTDSSAIVDVTIHNTSGRITQPGDNIVVTLDSGMNYLLGFVGMHNPPLPTSLVANGQLLQWPMPVGIAPSDSIWFRFDVGLGTGYCRSWDLFAQSTFLAPVSCPDTICTLVAITGNDSTTDSLCCCHGTAMTYHPDAIADSLQYQCDSMEVNGTFRVCNGGNMPLGASTTYAWYAHHPGNSSNPMLLGTNTLGAAVPPGGCIVRPFSIPRGIDSVFIVVNDLGQGPYPYNFSGQLPYDLSGECHFLNNVIGLPLDCICDSLNVHAMFSVSVSGGTVALVDTSTGPVSMVQWIVNGSMVPGLPGETRTVTFDSIGTYAICLIAIANGSCPHSQSSSAYCCSDTLCTTVTIDSCGLFHANFSHVVQNATGASVAFTDLSTPYPGTVTTWSFGDGDSATSVPGQTIIHQYPQFGTYTVTATAMVLLTDHLCCRSVYQAEVRVSKVHLFPNPASDFITVRYELPQGMIANVALVDAKGRLLQEAIGDADGLETFQIGGMPAGVYLVRITTPEAVWGDEFVID